MGIFEMVGITQTVIVEQGDESERGYL